MNQRTPEEIAQASRLLKWAGRLLFPAYLAIAVALVAAFLYAPTERVMGEVQRIFYFHVGSAWNGFFMFFLVLVSGFLYLVGRKPLYDEIGAASVEVGVLFITIVLTTGPIWAKPAWGVWFPIDEPRIMTTLVMWLMYVAYLILRDSLPEGEKRGKFCAVFGIIAALNVPIVYKSVDWWRGMHPKVIGGGEGSGLESRMLTTLLISVAAFTILALALLLLRTSMRLNQNSVGILRQQFLDAQRRKQN